MLREGKQIGMSYSSELTQWELGISVPLRMCFKSIHGAL